MAKAGVIEREILRDRERHRARSERGSGCFLCGRSFVYRKAEGDDSGRFCSQQCREAYDNGHNPQPEFDPIKVTAWRVIAGPDPGYMPKARMREGRHGFFIDCAQCRREFESKGLR